MSNNPSEPPADVPPPPADGDHAHDKVGKKDLPDGYDKVASHRRWYGMGLMLIGGIIVILVLWRGISGIEELGDARTICGGLKEAELERCLHVAERFAMAKLVVHAVVSVALVFFAYSVITAGERMLAIPPWLLRGSSPDDVDLIRAILGIDTPMRSALKLTKEFGSAVAEVAKPIAEAAVELAKKSKGGD